MKLKDRIAIITGSGSGIGKAIAIAFAKEGAHIVGAARRVDRLQETAKEVEALGRQSLMVKCDVTKKSEIDSMVKQTMDKFGKIDILVNNAALFPIEPFLEITEESFDRVIATNLRGTFFCSQAVIPKMVERKSGVIIMVNSLQSRTGFTTVMDHYVVSKGGILSLTRVLAFEFGRYGVRVNGIICSLTPETEGLVPFFEALPPEVREAIYEPYKKLSCLGRVGTISDYVGLAVFLASDDSAFITGQTIACDGGMTMV